MAKKSKRVVSLSKASQAHLDSLNAQASTRPADNVTADAIHGFAIRSLPSTDIKLRRRQKVQAGISLPAITFLDKPASRVTPEDVRQSRNPVRFAKVGMDTVLRGELPKDATRQEPATQLRALKAAIEHNLKRIVSLVKRGELDRAQIVCAIVAQQRGTAIGLADRLATAMALEAQAAKDMPARKPTLAVTVKQKRYNRWSEK